MIDLSKLTALASGGQSALVKIAAALIAGVLLLAVGFGAGWHFRGAENAAATVKVQAKAIDTGNKLNAADNKAAVANDTKRQAQAKRDQHVAVQAAVDVAKTPSYNACQLKPADLDLLNQAIDGGAP